MSSHGTTSSDGLTVPFDQDAILNEGDCSCMGGDEGLRFYSKSGGVAAERLFTPTLRVAAPPGPQEAGRWLGQSEALDAARKRIEDRNNRAQKMESLVIFAGGVARSFNNLLTPIIGYAELLRSSEGSLALRDEALNAILEAANGASELVRRMFAMSGKQAIESKWIDLCELVSRVEREVRRTLPDNIDLRIAIPRTLGAIQGDGSQLERGLLSLATNAREAMSSGGTLSIELSETELDDTVVAQHEHFQVSPGAYVMLSVSDTGRGMDERTKRRIFDPFYTTKESGGSRGLGLSTVYGIVKQHRGAISVHSELGRGTTIKVFLPKVALPEVRVEASWRDDAAVVGGETVLVVEDDDMVRRLMVKGLRNLGYTVLWVPASRLALELVQRKPSGQLGIDLLLTDVVLPNMDGRRLFRQLQVYLPDLKVVYVCDDVTDPSGHRYELEEAIVLAKPFSLSVLATKVREVLAGRRTTGPAPGFAQ